MALGSAISCTILTFKAFSGNLHMEDLYLRLEKDGWIRVFGEQTKTRELLAPIHLLAGKRMGALFLFFFLGFLVDWLFWFFGGCWLFICLFCFFVLLWSLILFF